MPKIVLKTKYNRPRHYEKVSHSIRTFDVHEKMPYMDSSIDLSQNEVKRIAYVRPKEYNMNDFRLQVGEQSGMFRDNLNFRKSEANNFSSY